ncbi:hypothetical protein GCM10020220_058070 [Nonomuraea rubra]
MKPRVQQCDSRAWAPAAPLPTQPGIDFEVIGSGPWTWQAYSGARLLASGRARTRIGPAWTVWRANRRLASQQTGETSQ